MEYYTVPKRLGKLYGLTGETVQIYIHILIKLYSIVIYAQILKVK